MTTTFSFPLGSPLGNLVAQFSEDGLQSLSFEEATVSIESTDAPDSVMEWLSSLSEELQSYFEGKTVEFTIPLVPEGTEFQQKVWLELQQIPLGTTWSYLELAERVGGQTWTRAVGTANGKNPIAILIPCHRVIGNDGQLRGYAGGLWRKKKLLELEGVENATVQQFSLEF